jgi:Sulfotransferase domain
MTLKLIGAGFGRTGTTSVKFAYEMLGLGRCYHMIEVFPNPAAPTRWIQAADGNADWAAVFDGYTATVDWPGCHFWRELMEAYPQAKVLLTVRDAEAWFASTQATIFAKDTGARIEAQPSDFVPMFEKIVIPDVGGKLDDHDTCIARYHQHNAAVIAAVPKDRLLVYDVKDGWGPLCRFLGVPVPDKPFPRANTSEDFQNRGPPGQRPEATTMPRP